MFRDPRTTIGGIIAAAAVLGLFCQWIDTRAAIELIGVAGAWVGISGKDSK
jgi:hypothetical protein